MCPPRLYQLKAHHSQTPFPPDLKISHNHSLARPNTSQTPNSSPPTPPTHTSPAKPAQTSFPYPTHPRPITVAPTSLDPHAYCTRPASPSSTSNDTRSHSFSVSGPGACVDGSFMAGLSYCVFLYGSSRSSQDGYFVSHVAHKTAKRSMWGKRDGWFVGQ